ncbi:MAG: preprotein translocase subunit YajC [Saprospiraceae bacterium]|nr:preprotein translocase subunit YajC [Saprospiraceae bacterium]
MNQSFLFLQATGANPATLNLLFIALIFGVFYFFMIRPQNKRQKEQRQFIENLQKGDDIVTAGGIYGKINKIEDNVITMDVGNKTFIRVNRSVVSKEMTDGMTKSE